MTYYYLEFCTYIVFETNTSIVTEGKSWIWSKNDSINTRRNSSSYLITFMFGKLRMLLQVVDHGRTASTEPYLPGGKRYVGGVDTPQSAEFVYSMPFLWYLDTTVLCVVSRRTQCKGNYENKVIWLKSSIGLCLGSCHMLFKKENVSNIEPLVRRATKGHIFVFCKYWDT